MSSVCRFASCTDLYSQFVVSRGLFFYTHHILYNDIHKISCSHILSLHTHAYNVYTYTEAIDKIYTHL